MKAKVQHIIITMNLIFALGCKKMDNPKNQNYLAAPLFSPFNLKKLDSKNIVTAIDYQLLINTNLTLLEYDNNTNLVTLLAEDYHIKDNQIIFHIKRGIKTISGHEITGKDAELSLKRLINSKGSHSRLSELVCLKQCNQGLFSEGYNLTIIALKKSYIPLILSLLTNADNVIYPTTAFDSDLPESSVVNFKETSGPYYFNHEKIDDIPLRKIELNLNKSHPFAMSNLAEKVTYSLSTNETIFNNNGLIPPINYIHNVIGIRKKYLNVISNNSNNHVIYKTAPIKNTILFSTVYGRSNLTKKDLVFYQLKIKELLFKSENPPEITQNQIEYFPKGSDGNLTSEQLKELISTYNHIATDYIPKKSIARLGLYKYAFERYHKILSLDKRLEIVQLSESPLIENHKNVDIFLDTIDSSFTESLDLLEYNKTFSLFKISDNEMNNYINAESKEDRIKILKEIHLRSLLSGYCLIIGSSPYTTILSNDWEASPSTMLVGYPVWKIKKKI